MDKKYWLLENGCIVRNDNKNITGIIIHRTNEYFTAELNNIPYKVYHTDNSIRKLLKYL